MAPTIGPMIPMHMAKDLAQQHAIDLRRMGRAGWPLRTRAIRWRWRDGWRLRTDGWHRRRRTTMRWDKGLAAATEGGPCPR